jgi:hypothetical protein
MTRFVARQLRRIGSALCVLAMLAPGDVRAQAAGDPGAACATLGDIISAAPRQFRDVASDEYVTLFESWRARITVAGFDACWIDDVTRAFWCIHRANGVAEAGRVAARQAERLDQCWPAVATHQTVETGDDGVTRLIQDWSVAEGRRIRLVHRKPSRGEGLSAVFLYVY